MTMHAVQQLLHRAGLVLEAGASRRRAWWAVLVDRQQELVWRGAGATLEAAILDAVQRHESGEPGRRDPSRLRGRY